METLPDLQSLSDDELSVLLTQIEEAEEEISRRRRVLHGRIDILRAERTSRLKAQVAAGSFHAPSPATLDDDELWAEIRRLEKEEDDISLSRRVMHAQIDIIRAERKKRTHGGDHVDPDDLGSILGGGG